MPRLFTGIELPTHVRDQLARLKAPLPGARWVEPANLHLTLRFAGDIDNRLAREFTDALGQIEADAFELRLAGLDVFGGNDPHTIYAGVEPSPPLDALARAHERAARNAGLAPDGRTFKPHVTLARVRHGQTLTIARFLGRNGAFKGVPFSVERFVLYSSRPKVGGGPYVIEASFPLAGAYSDFEWEEGHGRE
ncbi:MAG: RNA 2',3'-cyclic phosphodiesterase [Hyphomicrobium sp.]